MQGPDLGVNLAEPVATISEPGPEGGRPSSRSRASSKRARASDVLACRKDQHPGRVQAPGHIEPGLDVGVGHRGQLPTDRQPLLVSLQRRDLVADLRGQIAELEVGIPHRHARGPVGLILEQAFELAVEVGRALEQLVAQGLELVGLEHQVVADLAVEQLDRLHRQVEPLLLADRWPTSARRWPP